MVAHRWLGAMPFSGWVGVLSGKTPGPHAPRCLSGNPVPTRLWGMFLFVVASLLLLALPLVVLLVWSAVREARLRAELRAQALAVPQRMGEDASR